MLEKLKEIYHPVFEGELLKEIATSGTRRVALEGEIILDLHQKITAMPLLLRGAVKVLREDAEGNELLLYFLERGDTCAFSLSCCLGTAKSEIRAVAETETEYIMLPVEKIEEWNARYGSWRNFVFESYQNRLREMLLTIDTLAFRNMDGRILQYLQEKARVNNSETVQATHQQIATDLNTSRVVVSRLLKKLEMEKKIVLQRNQILLL